MNALSYSGGFADPPTHAALAFRAVMNAMARPGRIETLRGGHAPAPLSPAAATVILTLCDADTPVFLAPAFDTDGLRAWLAFHTGAPLTPAAQATFAVGTWVDLQPLEQYPRGTPEYPDRSATLIVEMDALTQTGAVLSGPGIKEQSELSLPDTAPFQANAKAFPLGLDFIFTAGDQMAALPRTTQVR